MKEYINILLDILVGKEVSKTIFDKESFIKVSILAKKNKCMDIWSRAKFDEMDRRDFKEEIRNLARVEIKDKLMEKERNNVVGIFERHGIGVIDLSLAGMLKNRYDDKIIVFGQDIDLLVRKSEMKTAAALLFASGYRIKNFPPQEIVFYHPDKKIEIDLHFYVCIPRDYLMSEKLSSEFTNEFIDDYEKRGEVSSEYLILANIANYWNNEFLRGLRNLRDIGFAVANNKDLSWEKFAKIARKYNLLDKSVVVLLINKNIFNLEVLKYFSESSLINWRAKIVANYFSSTRVGVFPDTSTWFDSYNKSTRKYLVENYIATLIADRKTSFIRMIRPRIIWFVLRSFF